MSDDAGGLRVIVVEDNGSDVILVSEALTAQQITHTIVHYRDGVEAARQLCDKPITEPPDLIILDVNMPRMNGLELLAHLKKVEKLNGVPVAMLTSSLEPEEHEEANRLGVDRYLRKPVDLYEYLDEIGRQLRDLLSQNHKYSG